MNYSHATITWGKFMTAIYRLSVGMLLLACIQLNACAQPAETAANRAEETNASPASANHQASSDSLLPSLLVHKSPTCGCCGVWVDRMREAGFSVEVRDTDDMNSIKEQLGIPAGKGSCHTAQVDGYFIEGHVPAEDIKRLLAEKPKAKGLTVPGMPIGSPGMESPDGRMDAYTVELVNTDGSTQAYAQHGGAVTVSNEPVNDIQ